MTDEKKPWHRTKEGKLLLAGSVVFLFGGGIGAALAGVGRMVEGFGGCIGRARGEYRVNIHEMDDKYNNDACERRKFLTEQLIHPDITSETREEILREYAKGPR